MFSWVALSRRPIIIAHRGSSAFAPENTLTAFRHALNDGADAIELDVRLTKDRKLVVIHDARLERTTDGRGRVSDHSLSELKKLTAGRWFHRRFASEKAPTLEETLQLIPPTVGLNIELKAERNDPFATALVRLCLELVRKDVSPGRILVSSFHHSLIKYLKNRFPEILTGLIFHPLRSFGRSAISKGTSIGVDFLVFDGSSIRKRIVRAAHEDGIFVAEYTVNSRWRAQRALRFDLDGIITNDPARVREFLGSKKIKKPS